MADGATDPATLDRYARAQAELEHHGGYLWRDRATAMARGLGFADEDLDRELATLLRRRADARVAGARARDARPTCCCSTSRPTTSTSSRSSGSSRRSSRSTPAIVLVAHDRWFLETVGTAVLELEARTLALLPRHRGTPGAPSRRRASWRSAARSSASRPRSRGSSASSRAGAPARARARRSRAPRRSRRSSAIERAPTDGAALSFQLRRAAAQRPRRSSSSRTAGSRSATPPIVLLEHAQLWLERGEHVSLVGPNGPGKTTLIETLAGRRPLAAGKLRTGHNVQIGYLSQHADELGSTRHGARGGAARDRADAEPGARAARPLPVRRRARREAARRPLGRRAAPALARDPRRQRRQRADPRRADQPPRSRVARGARGRAAARSAAR